MKFLTDLRNSFWFVPGLIVLMCGLLAVGAIELDGIVGKHVLARFPRLFGAGAEGARQLLSALAASTITVAGVVFSITIVALSLTAAQYSPSVLRNFMGDRANQVVLGIFLGVYAYCLLVLRTVRAGDEGFVPGISIVTALTLALVGIGVLILFIHHIALSIQVSHIAARIMRDTVTAIHRVRADSSTARHGTVRPPRDACFTHLISAPTHGYVQHIDITRLARVAHKYRRVVRTESAVGEFVVRGSALLRVTGSEPPDAALCNALVSAYVLNDYRDMRQDPWFGLQQLVEIALKALSPGVNDLGTARNVLHHITAILCELVILEPDENNVFERGELAVVKSSRTFEQTLDDAIFPIRHSAVREPAFLLELLTSLATVASRGGAEHRNAIAKHVHALGMASNFQSMPPEDARVLSTALKHAVETVTGASAGGRSGERTFPEEERELAAKRDCAR